VGIGKSIHTVQSRGKANRGYGTDSRHGYQPPAYLVLLCFLRDVSVGLRYLYGDRVDCGQLAHYVGG
jgi:hypothetical protein